ALSAGSAAAPRPSAAAFANVRRSNAASIFVPFLFLCPQFGTGRCIGLEVAENELRGGQKQCFHVGRLVKLRLVPKRAVEYPPLSVAANPHHPVIVVGTSGVLVRA